MGSSENPTTLLPLLLCLGLGACGPGRFYFRPAEKAFAESLQGFPAAEYQLSVGSERWGEVRIWSEGAELPKGDPEGQAIVTIGFEIENNGGTPLELEVGETRLRMVPPGASQVDCKLDQPPAEARADPREVHTTRLVFLLPQGVRPKDLESFRVRWVVKGSGQGRYEQQTAFVRREPSYPPRYRYPYYGYSIWLGSYCW